MTRTKKAPLASRRAIGGKRPSKAVKSKPKEAVAILLSPEQNIKRSLGRSAVHRGRLPVVMDGTTQCCIAKMGRRRMAVNVLSDIAPAQHMMMRPSLITTVPRAIECTLGLIADNAQGWNSMQKGTMLMAPMLHKAFIQYCTTKGGVWLDAIAEAEMMLQAISENELNEHDKNVMLAYAETEEGQTRRKARLESSSKAQITKRRSAQAKKDSDA